MPIMNFAPDRDQMPPWGILATPAWVVLAFLVGGLATILCYALPGDHRQAALHS